MFAARATGPRYDVPPMPNVALLVFALAGFAANSLLTRGALGGGHLDPLGFMLIRLWSGALVLSLLVRLRSMPRVGAGNWGMSAALAGYALAFTLAYTRIPAGAGALLLFAAVHLTMVAAGVMRGERPHVFGIVGNVLAFAGLVTLTAPGLDAPDPIGAALMVVAGAAWGVYSLKGRGSRDPLATTADNFLRAAALVLPSIIWAGPWEDADTQGVTLALTSGAIASGLAYAAWYAVLPALAAWRAALLQLAVPILAAIGATWLLAEPVTPRLIGAILLVVGGISVATFNAPGRK
jgi:drug/metabolite transporter (DMT)-like permease